MEEPYIEQILSELKLSKCQQKSLSHPFIVWENGTEYVNSQHIPEDIILQCDFNSLRPIAQRQIISLLERRKLTQNYPLYNWEINRVILFEQQLIKKIEYIKKY